MNHASDVQLPVDLTENERRGFWSKLRRSASRLPFARDLLAAYCCAMDSDTPRYVRVTLVGALAYFLMPADAVPDILAGLGFVDDASVLAAAIAAVRQHMRPYHFEEAETMLEELRTDSHHV